MHGQIDTGSFARQKSRVAAYIPLGKGQVKGL